MHTYIHTYYSESRLTLNDLRLRESNRLTLHRMEAPTASQLTMHETAPTVIPALMLMYHLAGTEYWNIAEDVRNLPDSVHDFLKDMSLDTLRDLVGINKCWILVINFMVM